MSAGYWIANFFLTVGVSISLYGAFKDRKDLYYLGFLIMISTIAVRFIVNLLVLG